MTPKKPRTSKPRATRLKQTPDETVTRLETALLAAHEELEQAREKQRSLKDEWERTFDSVPDLIAILDNEHRIIRINKAMAQRLGTKPDRCIGLHCHEAVHGLSAPPPFCPHSTTLRTGCRHSEEVYEERLGGDFLITTTPLANEHGEKIGSVHVAHDITARKQAEERTRHLASFPQLNPNPVIEVNAAGEILYCNPAAQKRLRDFGLELEGGGVFFPTDMPAMLAELKKHEERSYYREITIKDCIFGEVVQLVSRFEVIRIYAFDITERKRAEEALKESEQRVRHKLQSLVSPEGDIAGLELGDIIDAPSIQSLMDEFYRLAHIPMAIIDLKGKVLVGVGWQDICTKFHRVNPETCTYCIESDTMLTADVASGEYKIYKCKNNMWDVATPIEIGQRRLGHFFTGQFFFSDESLDYEFFRAQARQYGFPEEEYLAALERVPRLSREDVKSAMSFFMSLSVMISRLSYSNIKLARILVERDRLTASLRESETRLKRAQKIAHLGSWELDIPKNELTWSDEVYRIFGLEPQEFAATYEAFLERVHPDDRAAVDAAYFGSLREGRDTYEIEHRVVRKSGGEIRIVHEKCEHFRDGSGNIVRSIGMVHDITERKKAEEEIKRNLEGRKQAESELLRLNRTLKALSDSSQAVIRAKSEQEFLNDVCRIIVDDCGYMMAWIGFARNDEGRTVQPVAHAGFEQGYLETLHVTWADTERGRGPTGTAIRTGEVALCTNMLNDPSFSPWREQAIKRGYASSIVLPLISGEKTFGAVTIYSRETDPFTKGEIRLLTELAGNLSYGIEVLRTRVAQRNAEHALRLRSSELQAVNKELESFTYSVSHDLRAPLRSIAGFSKIVNEDYASFLDEKGKDYLARIYNGAVKMGKLIEDLLRLSRISRQDLGRTRVELSTVAASTLSELRQGDPERSVDVKIQEGLWASADLRLIELVFMNLLGNAWKFTSKTPNASIEFGSDQKDGTPVYFIRDNGAGFDSAYAKKVFLPFHRLHSENEFEGTGIGLAIVERVVNRHGGKIWAEGKHGKGAAFFFTLGEERID